MTSLTHPPAFPDPPGADDPPVRGHPMLTPATGVRQMLELPPSGDKIARRWAITAFVLYAGLGALLFVALAGAESPLELLGLGVTRNWVVFVLISTGVVATLAAFVRVFKDIHYMAAEEDDVDWVRRTGREGLVWVFTPRAERNAALLRGASVPMPMPSSGLEDIETLIDDRVRRTRNALKSGTMSSVSVSELRGIAEKHTSRFGEFPRYVASFLLLLAVLGTFAGVKAALPGLIRVLTTGGVDDPHLLAAPLSAVAGAFGGNALALVGAISLGVAAQGLAFGRRNLLARLELVSVEFIYGSETGSTVDPMHLAVQSLQSSARDLRSLSATLEGIESGLERLGEDFQGSLTQLTGDLRQMADRQDSDLYSRTGQALEALQRRVGDLVSVVEGNAHSSARLIDSVQLRAEEARAATSELQSSHEQMAISLDAFVAASKSAGDFFTSAQQRFSTMSTAADALTTSTTDIALRVAELRETISGVSTTNSQTAQVLATAIASTEKHDDQLRSMFERLSGALDSRSQALETFTRDQPLATVRNNSEPDQAINRAQRPERELPDSRPAIYASDPVPVLREISRKMDAFDSMQKNQKKVWVLIAITLFVGLLVSGGITYSLISFR